MSDLAVELTAPNGKKYTQPTGLFINNEWVASSKGNMITSINPTDESEIASVHAAEPEDVDKAVEAARAAFKGPWRDMSPSERGDLMFKLSQLVEENKELLATIETWDNGKPYQVALNEDLAEVSGCLKYYAGYADKVHGQVIDTGSAKLAYTIREPVGVCGQIIPWNYPLGMAAWKLGPALACGNTIVLKAAEQTPLSILVFANLVKEAGFPPGVLNILNGHGRVAGAAIAQHMGIDKIAFTGSTATGKEIMKSAAVNMKNITLETGGKSPLLVFDDADLDQAVKWSHIGIMSNMGQICTATSRILVQQGVYDKFVEAFKDYVGKTSKIGDPFSDETFQGPQVTKAQYERVLSYIEAGKSDGATLAMGGEAYKNVGNGKGFFVSPTVFTNVKSDMRVFREEVFGPFVVIASFKTEEEALEKANDTTYGLGSAVFTKDIVKAHRIARKIEAGMVWINSSQDSDYRIPFGGVKQSGIGRELGEAGLEAYSNKKAVHVNLGSWLQPGSRPNGAQPEHPGADHPVTALQTDGSPFGVADSPSTLHRYHTALPTQTPPLVANSVDTSIGSRTLTESCALVYASITGRPDPAERVIDISIIITTLARRQQHEDWPPSALQVESPGGAGHNSFHAKALNTASAEIHCLAFLARLFKPP
ncbi:retinal dehydrogenase 2 [Hortaea werneckii]|nr:retinal dehydrogenase 2 [Hortaea werneckii]KAI7095625.1 retinal dehydrogenase 2 [Hortaea werneckii]KAI7208585.1 retinal dehydrogenase 2 [Hortaea werneckii]KAI7292113.1 retinal dehydrogenase 2 [Hortaea werneckii]KAI7358474.1 retinal dehydrogenase 2 [Hortaea werneckii]